MKRQKYEWAQVIGHAAPTNGYCSRKPNGRWGVPEEEKYKIIQQVQMAANVDRGLAFETKTQRINIKEIKQNGDIVW